MHHDQAACTLVAHFLQAPTQGSEILHVHGRVYGERGSASLIGRSPCFASLMTYMDDKMMKLKAAPNDGTTYCCPGGQPGDSCRHCCLDQFVCQRDCQESCTWPMQQSFSCLLRAQLATGLVIAPHDYRSFLIGTCETLYATETQQTMS